jgi:putative aldouronate transport system permease protein
MDPVRQGRKNPAKRAIRASAPDRVFNAFDAVVMSATFLLVAYPLYFVLIASVSDPDLVNAGRVLFWPREFTLQGYERIFSISKIWNGYRNTILYTLTGTCASLFLTLTGGYALSRRAMPARGFFMGMFTFTIFFNGGMIPMYLLLRGLGMLDTVWSLILPGGLSVWNLIIARTFYQSSIPEELMEAADLDGCGQIRFFWAVALPLTQALAAVIGLYYMVGLWNSYFNAILYIKTPSKYPLQLILREILIMDQNQEMLGDMWDFVERQKTAQLIKYGVIVASTLPLICAYPFLQRYFVKGVMIGSLKG